ncbi:SPFH domain-containing protein [Brachybacterium sp. AOP25-B2-12]|uniref:SPFH domain-containing protein n=1 Tax=Brachybacterium sp. AOP25-B2-12 TaxID=3457710 RepID=UPI004034D8B9
MITFTIPEDSMTPGAVAWRRSRLRAPVALPGHALLRSRGGRVEVLTGRPWARSGDRFCQVDLRGRLLTLAPQAIATREGVDAHVTAVVALHVADPVASVLTTDDGDAAVYLAVQIALRDQVAGIELADLLLRGLDLAPVAEAARDAAVRVGLAVDRVALKDVRAPRTLASAREEALAVELTAQADLERARAEVRATRARLAAAQLLDRSPVLARIRLLEALPAGTRLSVSDTGLGALVAGAQDDGAADDGTVPRAEAD